jgi:putative SOS response-associated peptidase YedK
MCNDFGNHIPYDDYLRAFSQTRIPVRLPSAAPNLEPRDDIWPTDTAPVIRQTDHGHEFIQLRWGFPPAKPKGPPIINFRSEKRRFLVGRCLVPASHFYEFTGKNRRRLSGNSRKPARTGFCFAGLWRPMPEGGAAFTLLTTEPGPDVAPIHDRQMVILNRDDWTSWLDLTRPEAELLKPLPAGSLTVMQVRS